MAEGDGGQGPALRAHSGAFGEEHRRSSLRGGRPLHGHRPPVVFAVEACGGRRCGVIYLFAEARSGEGGLARACFLGRRRQPQAACTSSESVEVHAAKTRLGTGAPGQQPARNSAQTAGKEQAPSSRTGARLAVIVPAIASAGDGDVPQQQRLPSREPRGAASAGDAEGFTARPPVTAALPGHSSGTATADDNGQKSADGALQRFDKSLEEFYALCDQLELCLRLAHECLSQSFDSAKHAPALVPAAPKGEGGAGETLPYTQYLPLIKAQIAGAKDIHNALLEGANKITGKLPPPGGP